MATDTDSERASAETPEPRVEVAVAPAPKKPGKSTASGDVLKRVVGVLVVIGLIVGGYFFLSGGNGAACSGGESSKSSDGMTTLRETTACYEVKYPSSWKEVRGQKDTPVTVGRHYIRANDEAVITLATYRLDKAAGSDLQAMRAVADSILSTPGAHLQVVDVSQTKVAGLPALRYLYYFPDGKQKGVHAHYFVFDGRLMHMLIFEANPAEKFKNYAKQFDEVLASFKPLTP